MIRSGNIVTFTTYTYNMDLKKLDKKIVDARNNVVIDEYNHAQAHMMITVSNKTLQDLMNKFDDDHVMHAKQMLKELNTNYAKAFASYKELMKSKRELGSRIVEYINRKNPTAKIEYDIDLNESMAKSGYYSCDNVCYDKSMKKSCAEMTFSMCQDQPDNCLPIHGRNEISQNQPRSEGCIPLEEKIETPQKQPETKVADDNKDNNKIPVNEERPKKEKTPKPNEVFNQLVYDTTHPRLFMTLLVAGLMVPLLLDTGHMGYGMTVILATFSCLFFGCYSLITIARMAAFMRKDKHLRLAGNTGRYYAEQAFNLVVFLISFHLMLFTNANVVVFILTSLYFMNNIANILKYFKYKQTFSPGDECGEGFDIIWNVFLFIVTNIMCFNIALYTNIMALFRFMWKLIKSMSRFVVSYKCQCGRTHSISEFLNKEH